MSSNTQLNPDLKVHQGSQLENNHSSSCKQARPLFSISASINGLQTFLSHVHLVRLTSSQAHAPCISVFALCNLRSYAPSLKMPDRRLICADLSLLIFFIPAPPPPMTGTLALHFSTPDTTL